MFPTREQFKHPIQSTVALRRIATSPLEILRHCHKLQEIFWTFILLLLLSPSHSPSPSSPSLGQLFITIRVKPASIAASAQALHHSGQRQAFTETSQSERAAPEWSRKRTQRERRLGTSRRPCFQTGFKLFQTYSVPSSIFLFLKIQERLVLYRFCCPKFVSKWMTQRRSSKSASSKNDSARKKKARALVASTK